MSGEGFDLAGMLVLIVIWWALALGYERRRRRASNAPAQERAARLVHGVDASTRRWR